MGSGRSGERSRGLEEGSRALNALPDRMTSLPPDPMQSILSYSMLFILYSCNLFLFPDVC